MPAIGLGTWRSDRSQVSKAVETTLRAGYRAGVRASGVPREEIWHARQCVDKSLRNIGHDYFDMYLINWPYSRDAENPAMQKLVDEGRVRNIGVSNFGIQHPEKLLNSPSTDLINQIELHPCNPSPKLVAYNTSKGIHTEAYSVLYCNEALLNIVEAKEKTPKQVLLQWGLQKGWRVVPKSVTRWRVESNLDLDDSERAELDRIEERFEAVNDGFLTISSIKGDLERK
ncbi:NADP-dependent oxidoreductase domain-containing protein [Fusarium avenaceum]|nr:NADP-dependent oxidoreductase domain-containing protein [Fusarium avenaceum]